MADPALAVTLRFRLDRERDHDAVRRAAESLCAEVSRRGGVIGGWGDVVAAALHPALPAIEAQPSGASLIGRACCWPAGPGFHETVLAVLAAVAEDAAVDLHVDDPTSFQVSGDRAVLERSFVDALTDAARTALGFMEQVGPRAHVQLGMPREGDLEHLRLEGDPPGLYTPEGKRDLAWIKSLAVGELPPEAFFPWWQTELDEDGARRLARSLVETRLTWRPARTDRQRHLRRVALEGLRRGAESAPLEILRLRTSLEKLASGEDATLPVGLRAHRRIAPLAGGWSTIVPGHFEVATADGLHVPPGVEAGFVLIDVHTRIEALAQAAPAGIALSERIANVLAQPAAELACLRVEPDKEPRFGGYAVERPLADGGTVLIGSLVGERSHLAIRIVTTKEGDVEDGRAIFQSIAPERPSPTVLTL